MTKKILLIEHDPDVRDIVTYVLKDAGYDVAICGWPCDANRANSADLLLVDTLNGTEHAAAICKDLKRVTASYTIPIIVLTTAVNPESARLACGADGVIAQPFDIDDLRAMVDLFLGVDRQ